LVSGSDTVITLGFSALTLLIYSNRKGSSLAKTHSIYWVHSMGPERSPLSRVVVVVIVVDVVDIDAQAARDSTASDPW